MTNSKKEGTTKVNAGKSDGKKKEIIKIPKKINCFNGIWLELPKKKTSSKKDKQIKESLYCDIVGLKFETKDLPKNITELDVNIYEKDY